MKVALSFCPNDTFIFYAWIHGKVGEAIEPTFADLSNLNPWAIEGKFPLIKLSCAAYAHAIKDYWFLPVGAALGFGCGPKLLTTPGRTLDSLQSVAVPGRWTTAELLLDSLLNLPSKRHYCRYDEVTDLIKRGVVDGGVIIHETRFTFETEGLIELVDLGLLWENKYALPLPLGGLALKRSIADPEKIIETLRASIAYAKAHQSEVLPFMQKHSQEKSPSVIQQHVTTYVNQESEGLSQQGIVALETLLNSKHSEWLYEDSLSFSNN